MRISIFVFSFLGTLSIASEAQNKVLTGIVVNCLKNETI